MKPTIVLDGAELELTAVEVDIDDVRLDPHNPRIRYLLSHKPGNPTQEQLKELLMGVSGVQELLRKIRDNQGSIEPIIVKQDNTVIEGNCRVTCYRHLKAKDAKYQKIQALRLPKVTQKQIDILLCKYHVSGKISWRSYAQASQVYELKNTHDMSLEDIAKVIGISVAQVRQLVKTYEVMTNSILPKLPGSPGLKKFSYVFEFFKNADLEDWRGEKKHIDEFASWVVEGKIKKGAEVRELPAIVRSPAALKAMRTEKEGARKALQMVTRPRELELLEKALDILGGLKPTVIKIIQGDKAEQALIKALHEKVQHVAEVANIKLK